MNGYLGLAALYRKTDGKLVRDPDASTRRLNFQNNRLTAGGFGLASTLDDYMRFARMLLGRGELDGTRILKAVHRAPDVGGRTRSACHWSGSSSRAKAP